MFFFNGNFLLSLDKLCMFNYSSIISIVLHISTILSVIVLRITTEIELPSSV